MDAQNDAGLRRTRSGNAEAEATLPDGWQIGICPHTGIRYYFNVGLRLTQWEIPEGSDEAEVKRKIAALQPAAKKPRLGQQLPTTQQPLNQQRVDNFFGGSP